MRDLDRIYRNHYTQGRKRRKQPLRRVLIKAHRLIWLKNAIDENK